MRRGLKCVWLGGNRCGLAAIELRKLTCITDAVEIHHVSISVKNSL